MDKKLIGWLVPIILLFTFWVRADVPPDAGKIRVKIDMITETTEDLSGFRFFLDFYGDLREVEVKSNGRTIIPPMGGGARYSGGTLLAIPKKSLGGFEEKLSNEQLENLSGAINKKEIEGVIELAKHRFSADIPSGEKPSETYYVIKREGETLKAERITDEQQRSDANQQTETLTARSGLIAGGILIALAVLFVGVLGFRKVSKKV
jgi:hypothetical protein